MNDKYNFVGLLSLSKEFNWTVKLNMKNKTYVYIYVTENLNSQNDHLNFCKSNP